ncbi:MAG: hypothetical protein RL441_1063, partial [Actinomycetota bacterium]
VIVSFVAGMALQRSLTRDPNATSTKLPKGTFRRVLSYAEASKSLLIWMVTLLIAGSLITVAQPMLSRHIVDNGIQVGNRDVVVIGALLIALAAVIDAAIGVVTRYVSSRIGENLILDMRTQVFRHVQNQSLAFFTRTQTGSLVSRINSDVIGAQRAFTSTMSGVLGNLIRVVLVIGTMLSLSWKLTLGILILVPLFLLPARWMGRRLQELTHEQMKLNAEMQTTMTERFNVSGALLVKLFGSVEGETKEFHDKAARVRDTGIKIAVSNNFLFTSLILIASLATSLVYGFGGLATIAGTVSIGTLLALIGLLAQVYGPLTALSNVRVEVMTALVSFHRVFEVLDLEPMVQDRPDALEVPDGALSVDFDHVTFKYPTADEVSLASLEGVLRSETVAGDEATLKDISFSVPAGHVVALVGPSGAGKTTITSLLPRFYDVTDGAIRIGGIDVRDLKQEEIRHAVGIVTQDSHLFHDTIRANLLFAKPDATDAEMVAAIQDAALGDLLAALPDGLDTVVGDRGHRLSGGEKQRMAIARVLLKSPRVIILDEATSHLDSESEAQIQAAFGRALQGRTAVVIAHRLSTVRNADQIIVVDAGKVVDRGTHDELLQRGGLYAELYRIQFAV